MNPITSLFRKLFLVKEIVSRSGEVHFRRYRLIQTPWFAIYLHKICQSDMDRDMHDHPWNFTSLILKGAYQEDVREYPKFDHIRTMVYEPGDRVSHRAEDAHKLSLVTDSVWTLVMTSGHDRYWGYRLRDGTWIGHAEYRQLKNEGKL